MSSGEINSGDFDLDAPLSIHAMTVAYGGRPVLWEVDYNAPSGGLVAIVGPNGAGKTTLIRAALGLIPRLSGGTTFWGKPFSAVRSRVAYVPQRGLVDWDFPITVREVVLMGRYGRVGWLKRPRSEDYDRADQALQQLDLGLLAGRQIRELSGGQQQRVFLARALAQSADLYLMDEPLQGIDVTTEEVIVSQLKRLRGEGKTILCVHHDITTVADYFTDVLLLNTRITAAGPVERVFSPANIKATYGPRLTVLEEAASALRR